MYDSSKFDNYFVASVLKVEGRRTCRGWKAAPGFASDKDAISEA